MNELDYPEQRFWFSFLALSELGRTLAWMTVARMTLMINKTSLNIVQVCLCLMDHWGDIFNKLRSATVAPMLDRGHGHYIQILNTWTSLDTNIIGHQIIHESDHELHGLPWVIRSGIHQVLKWSKGLVSVLLYSLTMRYLFRHYCSIIRKTWTKSMSLISKHLRSPFWWTLFGT